MSYGTYVRRGYVDSEKVNQLSDAAECCYGRTLLIADDAGRFDARPSLLRSAIYPTKDVPLERIELFLKEAQAAHLVILYEVNGQPFGQLTRWAKRGNASRSDYPWKDGSFDIGYASLQTPFGLKDFVASSLNGDGRPTPSAGGGDGVGMGGAPHGKGVRVGGNPSRPTPVYSSSSSTPTPMGGPGGKRARQPSTWELEKLLERTRARMTWITDRFRSTSADWRKAHPEKYREYDELRKTAEGLEKRLLERARGFGEQKK